jgi:signal transduction histidine kinase
VLSPLAAVPPPVLAAASNSGSLAMFVAIRLASSRVRLAARQAVAVHRELANELPLIAGHGGQLREAIFNLIINALEAIRSTTNQSRYCT